MGVGNLLRALVALSVGASSFSCGDGGKLRVRSVESIALVDPARVDFGDVALGLQGHAAVNVHNGGLVPLSVDRVESSGPTDGSFEVRGLPLSLRPGETSALEVRFRPSQAGTHESRLELRSDLPSAGPVSLDLRGHAVLGLASYSGDVLDFGNVVVGETSALSFTLTNGDGRAQTEVQIPAISGSDAASFAADLKGTIVMVTQQQVQVTVRFTPGSIGAKSAAILVVPCPTCQPHAVMLRGAGVLSLVRMDPARLDFGFVQLGSSGGKAFSLTSIAPRPLLVSALSSSDEAYAARLDGVRLPTTLAPGQTVRGTVTFTPRSFHDHDARLSASASDGAPGALELAGVGVGPQIVPQPPQLVVGPAVPNTTRTKPLLISNQGFDPQRNLPLVVTGLRLQTDDPLAWSFSAPHLPWTVGEPGAIGKILIGFTPQGVGNSAATLIVESNDGLRPRLSVPISSFGRVLLPCNPRIEPAGIVDFGAIHLYDPSTQGFEIINDGSQDCIIGEPDIISGGPAFHWPGYIQPEGRQLPPGGRMSVRVQFTPEAVQTYDGMVEMYLSNSSIPRLRVALRGQGDGGCFVVGPGAVDFGGAQSGCRPPDRDAFASNWCPGPVTITGMSINRPQFTFGPGISTPIVLLPNRQVQIPLQYRASTPGDDVAALAVSATSRATPYQVGLTAGALPDQQVHDAWDQTAPKVDLLLSIDNSTTMGEEQQALASSLGHLWNRIASAGADFHIAVTTTGMTPVTAGPLQCPGGAEGGEAGRFFPVDGSQPRILMPQTPDVQGGLFANTHVGLCQSSTRFLDAAAAALTPPLITSVKAPGTPWPDDGNAGFLREDARLSLLVVSDSDDGNRVSNPPPVAQQVAQIIGAKQGAADLVSFAGIVPLSSCTTAAQFPAPRFQEIARAFGGRLYDVCNLGAFGSVLDGAAGDLLRPMTSFRLTATPYDPSRIVVAVDGLRSANWNYDPGTNRIVFSPGVAPAPGSHITADYLSTCR